MKDLIQSFTINTVLFGVAAVFATKAYKWIAPILFGRRKGETLPERVKRVAGDQEQDRLKQRDLNMGRERALHVRSVNVGVLFAFMVLVGTFFPRVGFPFTHEVLLAFGAYVIVGYLAGLLFKVVPAEAMAGLNWNSRLDVRLYYVWLWPLNVYKRITRNH
ncbi:hypothetical protein [Pandoraea oxalativorans]|uniref:Uncharacterized protein n=1 Tax=Pandoraea oxalativorans TaxID=573737 RepID=A0A0G3IGW1_9BURK|nr:hypothetical protein [Pandoraea oxalativorans]AKK25101.1 hypothetical protein MB84_30735 [Pandoraea oxalativorans]